MAWYTINYKCGCRSSIQVRMTARANKINWYKTINCINCKYEKYVEELYNKMNENDSEQVYFTVNSR